ncbi:hypothetical protein DFH09DRAFT_1157778, partial [Mycena vulgaris]
PLPMPSPSCPRISPHAADPLGARAAFARLFGVLRRVHYASRRTPLSPSWDLSIAVSAAAHSTAEALPRARARVIFSPSLSTAQFPSIRSPPECAPPAHLLPSTPLPEFAPRPLITPDPNRAPSRPSHSAPRPQPRLAPVVPSSLVQNPNAAV